MQTLSPLNQQAIKDLITANWQKHHRIIAISALTVPIAFAAPSVLNRHDPFHITGRVVTAISLMIGGALVVKSAGELENLQPQIEKIKAQQMNFLGHGLGAEFYIEEEKLNLLAANTVYELENELDPEVNQLTPEVEVRSPSTTGNFSTSTPVVSNSEVAVVSNSEVAENSIFTQEQLTLVSRAITEDFSNTQIIEDILGYKGSKFKQGKQILEQIKKHLGANSND